MVEQAVQAERARDTDELEEFFFSTPPPAYELEIEPWPLQPMSAADRRAMTATIAMLGCAALAALGFAAFSDLVMVFPVPLRAAHAQLPEHGFGAQVTEQRATPPRSTPPAAQVAAAPTAQSAVPASPPTVALSAPVTRARSAHRTRAIARAARGPRASSVTGPAASAQALVKRAHAELGRGQAREAQRLASQAISLDPARAHGYIVLGGAHDALGDQAGKRAAFRACALRATDALVSTCKTLAR
jgi:hypothetical protein